MDVNEYIKQKYGLGEYSDENRKKLEQQSELGIMDKIGAAMAAAGAGIGGADPFAAGQQALASKRAEKMKSIENFDRGRTNRVQEIGLGRDAVKAQREDEQFGRDQDKFARENDLNSQESKMANELARSMGYKGDPITAAQFKDFSPVMQKRFEIEQEKIRRAKESSQKEKELSAAQAKQKGNFETGLLAEQQYRGAVSDTSEYDPTSLTEFLDNSNWAPNWAKSDSSIKARAAQDAWIETFLRDASGAAIPEAERNSYRKQFFPQPGDPASVVTNKAALREQKIANAKAGAGMQGPLQLSGKEEPDVAELARLELQKRRNAKKIAGGG